MKEDSKGKFNNLKDIFKAFESYPSIENVKKAIDTTENFFFPRVKTDKAQSLL